MKLTPKEYKRARSLRMRLQLLKMWDRVGSIVMYPWVFYKSRQKKWNEELWSIYKKMTKPEEPVQTAYFKKDNDEFLSRFYSSGLGDPIDVIRTKERLFQELKKAKQYVKEHTSDKTDV